MMKQRVMIAAAILALSQFAFADRYLVLLKNADTFSEMHSQFVLSAGAKLSALSYHKNGRVQPLITAEDGRVEDSLENLKVLVISSEDGSAVRALQNSSEVESVEKEVIHPAPKPVAGYLPTKAWNYALHSELLRQNLVSSADISVGANTPWGIVAVKAPQAWAQANYGEGARVAIIDTGIDKDHPAIAPNFERGQDFLSDGNSPYAFFDQVGHGTHVAGTIAGAYQDGGFVGVAPRAKILSGRVCNKDGCDSIAIAQAINWAITQKVDVISMSLGGSQSTPGEQRAVAAADKKGIVVVAASGNDGAGTVGYPAALPTVIAVGAIDSSLTKASFSNWGPELAVVGPGVAVTSSVPVGSAQTSLATVAVDGGSPQTVNSQTLQGAPAEVVAQTAVVVDAGLGNPADFTGKSFAGKFALIERGTIKLADKVQNAIAAGAAGVVLYNNAPGLIMGTLAQDGSIVAVPVVMLEQTVGQDILSQTKAGRSVVVGIQTVPASFETMDGTSMATPHVSGVAALVRATNKNLTGAKVKALLKSTATPLAGPNDANQWGSGLVNAEAAVSAAANQ